MGFDSGLTSVTGSVTAVQYSGTMTPLNAYNSGASSTTMGTVGAGKKWTVVKMDMTYLPAAGQGNGYVKLNDVVCLATGGAGTTCINVKDSGIIPKAQAFQLTAGQTIKAVIDTAGTAMWTTVWYIEETA